MWAIAEGGAFFQVPCDSSGEGTGFWYAVYFDNDNKLERIKPLNEPMFRQ